MKDPYGGEVPLESAEDWDRLVAACEHVAEPYYPNWPRSIWNDGVSEVAFYRCVKCLEPMYEVPA